jgi:hypothetical protein
MSKIQNGEYTQGGMILSYEGTRVRINLISTMLVKYDADGPKDFSWHMALVQVGVCHKYDVGGRPRLLDVVDG